MTSRQPMTPAFQVPLSEACRFAGVELFRWLLIAADVAEDADCDRDAAECLRWASVMGREPVVDGYDYDDDGYSWVDLSRSSLTLKSKASLPWQLYQGCLDFVKENNYDMSKRIKTDAYLRLIYAWPIARAFGWEPRETVTT